MDPNAALEELKEAKRDRMAPWLIREKREILQFWVANGGFEPDDPNWREI